MLYWSLILGINRNRPKLTDFPHLIPHFNDLTPHFEVYQSYVKDFFLRSEGTLNFSRLFNNIPYHKGTKLQSLIDEVYPITRFIRFKRLITDEYLTVKEISKEYQVTTRYIRKIITSLINETSENLLYKDPTQKWLIHRLLLPKFKPKRSKVPKYYALSIDPVAQYTETEIDVIMKFVLNNMGDDNIEVCYTIERKKANGRNHVHCYVNCQQRKKLIEQVRLGFSSVSYHQQDIYDLQGWKNYITKDGTAIKTIKN